MTASFRLTLLLLAIALGGCARFSERSTGLVDGALTPCPAWPRCVSSQARDPDKQVAPLRLVDSRNATWEQVKTLVDNMPRTRVVSAHDNYLHAEVTSPWGVYTDDLELLRTPASTTVQVRSSARLGYYDFQVNRERVEMLRQRLADAGLLER